MSIAETRSTVVTGRREDEFGAIPTEIALALNPHLHQEIADQPLTILNGGISGGFITAAGNIVLKFNLKSPERIRREISGRRFLNTHGFDGVSPNFQLIPSLQDQPRGRHPFVVMPLIQGATLADFIKASETQQAAGIVNTILEAKKAWWTDNHGNRIDDLGSMQRLEWAETLALIPVALRQLAEHFEIDTNKFVHLPLTIDCQTYPSLSETVTLVRSLLSESPPYTRPCHGDLSANNIIVTPDGKIHATDGEWAGHADPAEALVRIIKQESSRTLRLLQARVEVSADSLQIDMVGEIPGAARTCQSIGMEHLADFAELFRDKSLPARFHTYMAGSYLRELALGPRRLPDPQMLLYPVIKAASHAAQAAY